VAQFHSFEGLDKIALSLGAIDLMDREEFMGVCEADNCDSLESEADADTLEAIRQSFNLRF
jgi:hypothetical protein